MRSINVLSAAVAAVALLACNSGQPTTYRVAVDESPRLALPPTCFANNEIPGGTERSTVNNLRTEYNWNLWDGVDGKQYLDLGTASFPLGHAAPITIDDLIEGSDNVFVGTRTTTRLPDTNNYSNVRTRTVTVTFENQGTSPTGTIDLVSNYTCTNCQQGETEQVGNKNCSTRLNWQARRIDVDRISVHGN
jgi:hypothetical protein